MQETMKKITIVTIRLMVIMALTLVYIQVHAQPNPGGPADAVPVDGGLAFLLAAGVGYGAKKAYDFKKGMRREK